MKNMWIDEACSISRPSPSLSGGVRSRPTIRSLIDRATRMSFARTVLRVWLRTVARAARRTDLSDPDAAYHRHHRRPKDNDEDGREDAPDHREQHLDRRLRRGLLGALTSLDAKLLRLDLEHLRDWNAELLGLDDGADEVAHRARVGARRHVSQGLTPDAAHPDLRKRLPELVDERALHLLCH